MVADGGASRLSGYEGSVGASTVNADCPVRKKEIHKQRAVENSLLKGKLADSDLRARKLEEEVQAMKDMNSMATSMAALLSGKSTTADVNLEEYQAKLKHIAALLTNMSSHPSEADSLAGATAASPLHKGTKRKSVTIKPLLDGVARQDPAKASPSQVTPMQLEQQDDATGVAIGLKPSNLLEKMTEQVSVQGNTATRKAPSNNQRSSYVQVGDVEEV